ncbi:FRG domain-containing protein [Frigoribacterium sp. UYMn621]|uniref:FRG domain-containing protein n=1 Tax=Frigoribacterium sp. UYMn621 TaxID=3156343 RepID=UPI003390840D
MSNWANIVGPTISSERTFAEVDKTNTAYSPELETAASFFERDEVVIDSSDNLNDEVTKLIRKNAELPLVWRGARDADWGLHNSLFLSLMKANGVIGPEAKPREAQPYPSEDQMVRTERVMIDVARDEWRLDGMSPLELLARLQHFGAPTRLIDVTRNPYIAAWFAVEKHDDTASKDGRLFALATRPVPSKSRPDIAQIDTTIRLEHNAGLALPFWHYLETSAQRQAADWGTGSKRRVWIPPAYDPRIVAQNAGFVVDGVPMTSQKTAPYFKKRTSSDYWKKADLLAAASIFTKTNHPATRPGPNQPNFSPTFSWRIIQKAKEDIRGVLESRFSYSRSTIYPDIAALAAYLRDNISSIAGRP